MKAGQPRRREPCTSLTALPARLQASEEQTTDHYSFTFSQTVTQCFSAVPRRSVFRKAGIRQSIRSLTSALPYASTESCRSRSPTYHLRSIIREPCRSTGTISSVIGIELTSVHTQSTFESSVLVATLDIVQSLLLSASPLIDPAATNNVLHFDWNFPSSVYQIL